MCNECGGCGLCTNCCIRRRQVEGGEQDRAEARIHAEADRAMAAELREARERAEAAESQLAAMMARRERQEEEREAARAEQRESEARRREAELRAAEVERQAEMRSEEAYARAQAERFSAELAANERMLEGEAELRRLAETAERRRRDEELIGEREAEAAATRRAEEEARRAMSPGGGESTLGWSSDEEISRIHRYEQERKMRDVELREQRLAHEREMAAMRREMLDQMGEFRNAVGDVVEHGRKALEEAPSEQRRSEERIAKVEEEARRREDTLKKELREQETAFRRREKDDKSRREEWAGRSAGLFDGVSGRSSSATLSAKERIVGAVGRAPKGLKETVEGREHKDPMRAYRATSDAGAEEARRGEVEHGRRHEEGGSGKEEEARTADGRPESDMGRLANVIEKAFTAVAKRDGNEDLPGNEDGEEVKFRGSRGLAALEAKYETNPRAALTAAGNSAKKILGVRPGAP